MARIAAFSHSADLAVQRMRWSARFRGSLRPFPLFSCLVPRCNPSFLQACSVFTFYAHPMEARRPTQASDFVGWPATRLNPASQAEQDETRAVTHSAPRRSEAASLA